MRTAFTLFLATALCTATAAAQPRPVDRNCAMSGVNCCQAKVDLFDYLAPQVGALRVKAVQGSLPDFRNGSLGVRIGL